MVGLTKVLVVDGSKTSRETVCSVMAAHCEQVIEAPGIAEARRIIENEKGLSLVLCDTSLADGDAGELLGDIASLTGPTPPVVVLATRPTESEATSVQSLGALAYLAKPISFIDLSRVLKRTQKTVSEVAPRIRRKALGTALLLADAQAGDSRREVASQVLWDIHDISVSGAFLETRGRVKPGRDIRLGLVLDGQMIRVQAKVMRLQEPSWEHVAGIGVAFQAFEQGAQEQLAAYIAQNGRGRAGRTAVSD